MAHKLGLAKDLDGSSTWNTVNRIVNSADKKLLHRVRTR